MPKSAFHLLFALVNIPQFKEDIPAEMAKRTGGAFFRVSEREALTEALDEVETLLRRPYAPPPHDKGVLTERIVNTLLEITRQEERVKAFRVARLFE